jgi:hypothetical protein
MRQCDNTPGGFRRPLLHGAAWEREHPRGPADVAHWCGAAEGAAEGAGEGAAAGALWVAPLAGDALVFYSGRPDGAPLRAPFAPRVLSDCHVRKTATEYDRKPGIKWLGCNAK